MSRPMRECDPPRRCAECWCFICNQSGVDGKCLRIALSPRRVYAGDSCQAWEPRARRTDSEEE